MKNRFCPLIAKASNTNTLVNYVFVLLYFFPEFPVKIYPTRNMGEEDEKSGEEAGKFGKKYAFQKARSRLKYNLSYFGGERDGKYHPAACWKIHISL